MSKAIEEINELIKEVENLQVQPIFDTHIWDKEDLKQELLSIKYLLQKEIK